MDWKNIKAIFKLHSEIHSFQIFSASVFNFLVTLFMLSAYKSYQIFRTEKLVFMMIVVTFIVTVSCGYIPNKDKIFYLSIGFSRKQINDTMTVFYLGFAILNYIIYYIAKYLIIFLSYKNEQLTPVFLIKDLFVIQAVSILIIGIVSIILTRYSKQNNSDTKNNGFALERIVITAFWCILLFMPGIIGGPALAAVSFFNKYINNIFIAVLCYIISITLVHYMGKSVLDKTSY